MVNAEFIAGLNYVGDEAECIETSLEELVGEGEGVGRREVVVAS